MQVSATRSASKSAIGTSTTARRASPPDASARAIDTRRAWIIATLSAAGSTAVLLGLFQTEAREVGGFGLVGALPVSAIAGAVIMVVASVMSICSRRFDERLSAFTVTSLVLLISAAPAIVYDTARFSWAFKHVGIVDYIDRTRGFDQTIDVLPIYHNWPGFFAGAASLTDWLGEENAIRVAAWAPVALNLMTLLGLVYLVGQLTDSRRTVWLAALLFFVTNWIGQDYFSPQAAAIVLYLAITATALRFYRPDAEQKPTLAVHLLMLVMIFTMTTTHQLTPLVLVVALAGFLIWRRVAATWIPLICLVGSLFFWLTSWARTFVEANLAEELSGVGSPVSNAAETLAKAPVRSDEQSLVALSGRAIVLAIGLLAFAGLALRFWRRRYDGAPIVLLGAPLSMGVLEFGGEILFRIVLFMLPVLCLLAAEVLMAVRRPTLRAATAVAVCLAFFAAFSLAYFGKDGFYSFTDGEVAVVTQLLDEAPENSLLVEGSRNYPSQFLEYEKFDYVPLERESAATQARIGAAPADELHRWLSNDEYDAAYLLLTRSQQRAAEALGTLPADYLPSIESALRSDERFEIFIEDDDAVVFTLVER